MKTPVTCTTRRHADWYTTLTMEAASSAECHIPIHTASCQQRSRHLKPRALSLSRVIRQRCKVPEPVTARCVLRLQVRRRSPDMEDGSIAFKKRSWTVDKECYPKLWGLDGRKTTARNSTMLPGLWLDSFGMWLGVRFRDVTSNSNRTW